VTCSDFLKELTDYLDGAMDAQTKADLEDHLQWCHNCYVVCNTTKMTIEIYRDSTLYELPETLRESLRTAILSKCQSAKGNCTETPVRRRSSRSKS
jgi:predicted anti-sigma-YlaC factor YlaD